MPDDADWRSQPRTQRWQRRAVATLFSAQAVAGLGTGAGVGMGSLIAYEVTRSEALAGISRIVAAISVALLAVPLSNLAVRRGRRVALSLGWVAAVLGSVLLVLAGPLHSLVLLMGGMFCFGGGTAASLQSRFAATDMARPQRRASTLSFVMWGGTLGSVVGPNLALPGEAVARAWHLPPISGTYVLAALALVVGVAIVALGLRPDPMLVAREHGENAGSGRRGASWSAVRAIWARPLSRLAFVAIVANHMVMTGVMTLTPVHMKSGGHTLAVIGLTLSGHVLGMYGFSPLVGWFSDRAGRIAALWVCVALNAVALGCCIVAGQRLGLVMGALFLLGLAWSFGMVSASALLVDGVDPAHRTAAQGASDTVMNVGAALAAGAAGPVLGWGGFGGLAWVFSLPLVIMVLALVFTRRAAR